MKTPLTITAKVWNYCQLRCSYCVSGSSKERWKPTREPLPGEILDFERLIQWMHCYTPGAALHISGGEPLLWDGIEDAVQMVVENDIPATITTNGLLIEKRPALHDMPVKWLVTHHQGAPFEKWHRNASLIRHRPHLVCRLAKRGEALDPKIAAKYDDFNFCWSIIYGLRQIPWNPRITDLHSVASATIHLIEPNGRVFPCNCRTGGEIGNIHGMWYDRKRARQKDHSARQCVKGGCCQAYQSAVLTDSDSLRSSLSSHS